MGVGIMRDYAETAGLVRDVYYESIKREPKIRVGK
jgi:hypothetical protein